MDDRPQFGDVASPSDVDGSVRDTTKGDDGLYERDFFAWTQDRAAKLRARSDAALDWQNVAEEVESLGKRDRREVESRAARIVQHLLKLTYQPERVTRSWYATIRTQRDDLKRVLADSPSLRGKLVDAYSDVWHRARWDAVKETGLPIDTFPDTPEFTIEDVLDPDFMPGAPWSPDELIRD